MTRPQEFARHIRREVLRHSKRAGVGHIGSSLSIADLLGALYGEILEGEGPDDPGRDRFILSKGHAALALYAALNARGWLSAEDLATFGTDGTLLGVHPEHEARGIDFSTGSLGHGLPIGAGAALAARLQKAPRRVFVLVSDAECNEGSLWEAVMFAAHHRLSSLVAVVDLNGQQAFGYTRDVLNLSPLPEKFRAFGWDAHEMDGHDTDAIVRTVGALNVRSGPPHALVARTVFGRGVPFMESAIKWHYWPMSDEEYEEALKAVEGAP